MWTTQLHTETSSQNTTDPLAMVCVCECDSGNIDHGPGKPELYLEARGGRQGGLKGLMSFHPWGVGE